MNKLAVAAAVLVLLLLAGGIALRQPVDITVERSLVMSAPPEVVFVELHDLKNWALWPVFATNHVPGSDRLEGSTWSFLSKDDPDAEPKSIVLESATPQLLLLTAGNPRHRSKWTIELQPEGTGTRVRWRHQITFFAMGKLASLVRSPDSVIGPLLDESLRNLDEATKKKSPL